MAITKRFILVHDRRRPEYVIDVLEASGTQAAFDRVEEINRSKGGFKSASWVKADSIDELINANPYVKIWHLEKQLESKAVTAEPTTTIQLGPVGPEEVESAIAIDPLPEPKKDPKLFWSNGKKRQDK
jgi:hypothetical protein